MRSGRLSPTQCRPAVHLKCLAPAATGYSPSSRMGRKETILTMLGLRGCLPVVDETKRDLPIHRTLPLGEKKKSLWESKMIFRYTIFFIFNCCYFLEIIKSEVGWDPERGIYHAVIYSRDSDMLSWIGLSTCLHHCHSTLFTRSVLPSLRKTGKR